jgi:hypothetical protein
MTQRTQEQRVHDDLPTQLRKNLYRKERRDVPEVAPREEGHLWCISKGEEGEGGGGHQ